MAVPDKRFPGMKNRNGTYKVKIGRPKKPKSGWKRWAVPRVAAERAARGIETILTEREAQVLLFVRTTQYEQLRTPSAQEISEAFLCTRWWIRTLVKSLVRKGFLEYNTKEKIILFPRKTKFPWDDWSQFPTNIFTTPPDA